jgi:hypothetical protein
MGTIMSLLHVCWQWRVVVQGCLRRNLLYALVPQRGPGRGLGLPPDFVRKIVGAVWTELDYPVPGIEAPCMYASQPTCGRDSWPAPGVAAVVDATILSGLDNMVGALRTTEKWQWDLRVPALLKARILAVYNHSISVEDCQKTLDLFRRSGGWDWDVELARPGRPAGTASAEYMGLIAMGIDVFALAAESRAGCKARVSQAELVAMEGYRFEASASLVRHIQALRVEKWAATNETWFHPGRVGWWGPKKVAQVRAATILRPPGQPDMLGLDRTRCVRPVANLLKMMHLGWSAERWLRLGGSISDAQKELIQLEVSVLKITPADAHGALGVCDEELTKTVHSCQRLILYRADISAQEVYAQIKPLHKLVRWKRHYLTDACAQAGEVAEEWMGRGWVNEIVG